jgi:hypothetical protein
VPLATQTVTLACYVLATVGESLVSFLESMQCRN